MAKKAELEGLKVKGREGVGVWGEVCAKIRMKTTKTMIRTMF